MSDSYQLPKVKKYVEALMTPLIKAQTQVFDTKIKSLEDEIIELKARVAEIENSTED